MRGLGESQHTEILDGEVDTNVTPEMGQSSFLTCKSRGGYYIELENDEVVGRNTSVAHARAVHLYETFTRRQLIGLRDGIVFADFDRGPRAGDNGSDLNFWDRHCRSEASR